MAGRPGRSRRVVVAASGMVGATVGAGVTAVTAAVDLDAAVTLVVVFGRRSFRRLALRRGRGVDGNFIIVAATGKEISGIEKKRKIGPKRELA